MAVPESQLYPNDGIHGMSVSYYANNSFTAPVALRRLEPDIYADWGGGSPATETTLPVDNFSDTWLAQLESPYTGNVVLCVDSDDDSKVTVGGTVVIDRPNTTSSNFCSGNIAMTQGAQYSLRIDHIEKTGNAYIKLRWQYGTVVERVPSANLYATTTYTPPTNGLTASYYTDMVFNTTLAKNPSLQASFTRYDANIYANYGNGRTEYSELTSNSYWSTRWTGLLTAPCSGVYEFQTNGNVDDGGRMWIDQVRVANTWTYAALYGATYLAAGDHSFKFDWYQNTGGAQEFYAQTSASGTDFATLPTYPTAVNTPGVVNLGTATGASNTTWIGSDVGAKLVAANLKSQEYLKVTIRMVPNTELNASPTLTDWRQAYSCVPAE